MNPMNPNPCEASGGTRRPAAGYGVTASGQAYRPGSYLRTLPKSGQGYGHLLTVSVNRNPWPSRDQAIASICGYSTF